MKIFSSFLIYLYQKLLSPVLVLFFGRSCRFSPTCSEYSKEAILKHGVGRGVFLSLKRLIRCHPFSRGYYDPVPGVKSL